MYNICILIVLDMSDTEPEVIKSDDDIPDTITDEKNTTEPYDGEEEIEDTASDKNTVSDAENEELSDQSDKESDDEKSEKDEDEESEKEVPDEEINYEEQEETKDEKCYQKYAKKKKPDIEDKNLTIDPNKWGKYTIVKKKDRITGKQMTKYEYCRIVGVRATQIEKGAPPLIEVPKHITDYEDIAKLELHHKLCPYLVRRPLPNYLLEEWSIDEMTIWQDDKEVLELLDLSK